MAQLYYYDYPQPFHSLAPLKPADDSMNYWFGYPSQVYPEAKKVEKKKDEKPKDEKKEEKKDEKKEAKQDEKKDGKKEEKSKPKVIEMRVPLCCESCARRVRKKLEKMNGVEKPVICDIYEGKVTVTATAKPEDVLKNVRNVTQKDVEMWPQRK